MRISLLIIFFILTSRNIFPQTFNDSLYMHLFNFEVILGELNEQELKTIDLKKQFYIQEIEKDTNTEDIALYYFHNTYWEDVLNYFILVEKNSFKIYDCYSILYLISDIIKYKDIYPNKISDKILSTWIKKILQANSLEDCNNDTIVIKQNGIYQYCFPIRRIKSKGIIQNH